MCNRYRVTAHQAEIAARFGVILTPEPERLPPPELFPKRSGWVVRQHEGQRRLEVMQWGVPFNGKSITNVRNLQSGFWRNMLNTPARRCLVPVTGFCEWSGEKGSKREHWFNLRDAPIFAFAGVWRPAEAGDCFAFLTCGYLGDPSAHVVGAIHEKAIPVILQPEDEQRWLDGTYEDVCSLATPFPSQLFEVA
jgi:putative SOS response-associated peptidase YedK